MANITRYNTPVIPTYPFNDVKMSQVKEGSSNTDLSRNKNIRNGAAEDNDAETNDNRDVVADSLPLFREQPVKMRHSRVNKRERSRKCASVGAFECPPTANPRVSMYELGHYGWVCQKGDRDRDTYKNILNLDAEINDIIESNTIAEVNLGDIKIIF